jgi:Na+-driven multidrug efflux pump
MIIFLTIWFIFTSKWIISLYTNDELLREEAYKALTIFYFNIYPDVYKGMLKGVIKALGIQKKCVYVNLFCHWLIYPLASSIFVFKFNWGIIGIWTAKTTLEFFILFWYSFIVQITDWDKVTEECR